MILASRDVGFKDSRKSPKMLLQNSDVGVCPCHKLKPLPFPLTDTAICVALELAEVQNIPASREEKT